MSIDLLIGTVKGLAVYEKQENRWLEVHRTLGDQEITSVDAQEGVILTGTRIGAFRSEDAGQTWENSSSGLDITHLRWLAFHPEVSGLVFAGTEPAGIFISTDSGEIWQGNPEVERLRDQYRWSLPYSPAAGCIRGFAFHGLRIYAAAEVGGVLRSDDRGITWALSNGDPSRSSGRINADVHSIAVHPTSPELVYAPTGGGFYRSWDGGGSWENRYPCYCRAVWVDPVDAEHLILGPADYVDRGGRIEESKDGGSTWQGANRGLKTPWSHHMVERFYQIDDQLAAVLSNGDIMVASPQALEWQPLLATAGEAKAMAWMAERERL